ncbi:hypothetical protein [Candidatus Poriferisodalis sp.]|uniref:hypothetical protein n=1 Tax=Candidatus Poriferisodalis sp. TaxID=3101277 RepID=UPI003B0264C2
MTTTTSRAPVGSQRSFVGSHEAPAAYAAAAVSRFPDDAALPRLAPAVDPDCALRLVDRAAFRPVS